MSAYIAEIDRARLMVSALGGHGEDKFTANMLDIAETALDALRDHAERQADAPVRPLGDDWQKSIAAILTREPWE